MMLPWFRLVVWLVGASLSSLEELEMEPTKMKHNGFVSRFFHPLQDPSFEGALIENQQENLVSK